jgi:hypothetical protein
MQTSPILQSKISGMKKRLSEPVISDSLLSSLALCALLSILTYTSRAVTIGGTWSFIDVDLPVVSLPFSDTGIHKFKEQPAVSLGTSTMVIAVTPSEMIFGDLTAFTRHRADVRDKFVVAHEDGSPQVTTLLAQAGEWSLDRKNRLGIRSDGLVIVLPDPAVPIAVVSGIVDTLRGSKVFTHVILGGGVL